MAKDASGQLFVIETLDGTDLQANNQTLNKSKGGREIAEFKGAVKKLVACKAIEGRTNRQGVGVYEITAEGFRMADAIGARSTQ